MELTILIVDDLAQDRERLAKALTLWFGARPELRAVVRCYASAESLLPLYRRGAADLIFLDICMQGMSGSELAHRLRQADEQVQLVFTTSSREYAFDAFPVHPFDYLVKPWDEKDIDRVLTGLLRLRAGAEPEITIRAPRAEHRVAYSRIVTVTAQGHRVELALTGGELLQSTMTFSELSEQLLNDPRFLDCNRGLIVNMDHAIGLEDGSALRMTGGLLCPLRSKGRAELLRRFSQYQISRMKRGAP